MLSIFCYINLKCCLIPYVPWYIVRAVTAQLNTVPKRFGVAELKDASEKGIPVSDL